MESPDTYVMRAEVELENASKARSSDAKAQHLEAAYTWALLSQTSMAVESTRLTSSLLKRLKTVSKKGK